MAFKAIRPSIPSATARSFFNIKEFKGLDKASGEDNFSPSRAIEMQNFIRSKVGQVQKRGGFHKVKSGNYWVDQSRETWILSNLQWIDFWNECRIFYNGTNVFITKKNENGEYVELDRSVMSALGGKKNVENAIGYSFGDCYYVLCRYDDKPAVMRFDGDAWTYMHDPPLGSETMATWTNGANVIATTNTTALYSSLIPVPQIVVNSRPTGGGNLMHSPSVLTPAVQETFTVDTSDLTDNICRRFQLSLQDVSLVYDGQRISSNEWMGNAGKKYWTLENGVRKLTEVGSQVLKQSVRVEVYVPYSADPETEIYHWKEICSPVIEPSIFAGGSSDFFNTELGALWIPSAAIGAAPVEGEANVRITYLRNLDAYDKTVNAFLQSGLYTKYGVDGYKDRVFMACSNRIYYSDMDQPLSFGELNYIEPCAEDKTIVAMGGQGKYLYAVDNTGVTYAIGGQVSEDDSNTFLADADFVILDHVQGEKPVGSILDVFGDEFCYLSEEGLVAIRHDDFYDKRYAQNRSRMLGNELKGKDLCACRWGNFLVIGAGRKLYLLDEMQQTTLPDFKYNGKQYEIFPFAFSQEFEAQLQWAWESGENAIDWTIQKIWVDGETLCVYNGMYILEYDQDLSTDVLIVDDTEQQYKICAQWITPPFTLSSFYRKKNILRFGLSVGESGSTVKVEYRVDGATAYADEVAQPDEVQWRLLRDYEGRFRVFDYGNINYGLWTYNSTVPKLQLIINRRPSRKCYSIQFRFTNDTTDKLALSEFGFAYETEVI